MAACALASEEQLSNEELAIALLSTALRDDPHSIRCGAAMLSAEGNDPRRLARLAVMERAVPAVRHVAEADIFLSFRHTCRGWKTSPREPPRRFLKFTAPTRRGRSGCWRCAVAGRWCRIPPLAKQRRRAHLESWQCRATQGSRFAATLDYGIPMGLEDYGSSTGVASMMAIELSSKPTVNAT